MKKKRGLISYINYDYEDDDYLYDEKNFKKRDLDEESKPKIAA